MIGSIVKLLEKRSVRPARSQEHGPVRIDKPELADAMAEKILDEIGDAPGSHGEVAARRPIVSWVLERPFAAYRN